MSTVECVRWQRPVPGAAIHPRPTKEFSKARETVQVATGRDFNSCLLNHYRNGNDSVGWHADDDPELGDAPVIASISLGCRRDFSLRLKSSPKTVVGP